MFRVGISGDLLNSRDEPCFGMGPLNLLKDREDIEISWMDKSITELDTEMTSKFDAILLNLPRANANCVSNSNRKLKIISRFGVGFCRNSFNANGKSNWNYFNYYVYIFDIKYIHFNIYELVQQKNGN